MEYLTTKQVAERMKLKSREVTTYAKKYGLLPELTFDGKPMWTEQDSGAFGAHYNDMQAGRLCPTCGRVKPDAETKPDAEEE